MILDIDIHEMRREPVQGRHIIRLAAQHQISRLVDETKVGLPDGFEIGKYLIDRFKHRRGMALVRQPNSAIRRLLCRLTRMRQIVVRLQTNANEIASEFFSNIQARPDLAQAVRSISIVQRHIGIGRHHRHVQPAGFHHLAHAPQFLIGCLYPTRTGAHANCLITRIRRNTDQLLKHHLQAHLARRLHNANRQGKLHGRSEHRT